MVTRHSRHDGHKATRHNSPVDKNLKKAGEPQPIIEDLKKRRVPAIKREPKKAGVSPPKRENLKKYDRDVVKLMIQSFAEKNEEKVKGTVEIAHTTKDRWVVHT